MEQPTATKWTPGPWFVGEDRANGISVFWKQDAMICPMRWIDGMNAAVVARVSADAHLIAAAPDLYAALKALVNVHEIYALMSLPFPPGTAFAHVQEVLTAARAALQRAEEPQ